MKDEKKVSMEVATSVNMDTNPLVEEKKEKIKETLEQPKEKPKKKRGRPRKKKEPEPVFDPIEIEKEANFILALIDQGRTYVGITKPVPEPQRVMFLQGYQGIVQKYGNQLGKYMPEIMFGLAVISIGYDTYAEAKKITMKKELAHDNNDIRKERKRKDNVDVGMDTEVGG